MLLLTVNISHVNQCRRTGLYSVHSILDLHLQTAGAEFGRQPEMTFTNGHQKLVERSLIKWSLCLGEPEQLSLLLLEGAQQAKRKTWSHMRFCVMPIRFHMMPMVIERGRSSKQACGWTTRGFFNTRLLDQ